MDLPGRLADTSLGWSEENKTLLLEAPPESGTSDHQVGRHGPLPYLFGGGVAIHERKQITHHPVR